MSELSDKSDVERTFIVTVRGAECDASTARIAIEMEIGTDMFGGAVIVRPADAAISVDALLSEESVRAFAAIAFPQFQSLSQGALERIADAFRASVDAASTGTEAQS